MDWTGSRWWSRGKRLETRLNEVGKGVYAVDPTWRGEVKSRDQFGSVYRHHAVMWRGAAAGWALDGLRERCSLGSARGELRALDVLTPAAAEEALPRLREAALPLPTPHFHLDAAWPSLKAWLVGAETPSRAAVRRVMASTTRSVARMLAAGVAPMELPLESIVVTRDESLPAAVPIGVDLAVPDSADSKLPSAKKTTDVVSEAFGAPPPHGMASLYRVAAAALGTLAHLVDGQRGWHRGEGAIGPALSAALARQARRQTGGGAREPFSWDLTEQLELVARALESSDQGFVLYVDLANLTRNVATEAAGAIAAPIGWAGLARDLCSHFGLDVGDWSGIVTNQRTGDRDKTHFQDFIASLHQASAVMLAVTGREPGDQNDDIELVRRMERDFEADPDLVGVLLTADKGMWRQHGSGDPPANLHFADLNSRAIADLVRAHRR